MLEILLFLLRLHKRMSDSNIKSLLSLAIPYNLSFCFTEEKDETFKELQFKPAKLISGKSPTSIPLIWFTSTSTCIKVRKKTQKRFCNWEKVDPPYRETTCSAFTFCRFQSCPYGSFVGFLRRIRIQTGSYLG